MSTQSAEKLGSSMPLVDLTTFKTLLAGATFGTALTAAGVYHPSVIVGQLKMQDFTMLKVFLTATATSSVVIPTARHFGFTKSQPPRGTSIGLFHDFDGNIIGGAMLGAGMALTGACPGTVLPQIATGTRSGMFVGTGGLLGALVFMESTHVDSAKHIPSPVIDKELGVKGGLAISGYAIFCGTIVAGAMWLLPGSHGSFVSPVIGGFCIGASQGVYLLLVRRTLGVSSAYGQAAQLLDWYFNNNKKSHPRPETRSMVFVVGILLGSLAFSRAVVVPTAPTIHIGALRALFGGAIMIYGARLASGCTSGHGISGMSQLSKGSFFAVASMFGAGILVAFLDELVRSL